MWVAFANEMQKLLTFFSAKNISIYAISNDQSFNNTLTNDIVSFEQLGPDFQRKNASVAKQLSAFYKCGY